MRRSTRKLYNPVQDATEYCRRGRDKEGFIKRFVDDNTGYGLFTTKKFSKDEFLLQYVGENISSEEGQKREDKYPENPDYDEDHEVDGYSPPSVMARKRQITQDPDYDEGHELDGYSPPSLMARKRQITQDKTRLSENKKKDRKYIKWNKEREAIVLSYFQGFIMNKESKKLPGRKDIQKFLKKTPQLGKQYDWKTIRTKVMNEKVKRERHLQERLSSLQVL